MGATVGEWRVFTGIVEEVGLVESSLHRETSQRTRFCATTVLADAEHGTSICVDGVCLTVAEKGETWFEADIMAETLSRSALSDLTVGRRVNLERAVRVSDRLDGHIVQGHVDGVGAVKSVDEQERWSMVGIDIDPALTKYMVVKGSIAVDGVSLTLVTVDEDQFSVSLIPTTLASTTLADWKPGRRVNVEVDVLAKYVEKLGTT